MRYTQYYPADKEWMWLWNWSGIEGGRMHIDDRLAIWNTFHDGAITRIFGAVPGRLNLRCEIEYLTELLSGEPIWIDIQLENVTLFEWRKFGPTGEYETTIDGTQLEIIASKEPEILSAAKKDDVVVVCCVEGCLNMRYESYSLKTSSGERLEYETLLKASELYWKNFKARGDV